MITERAATGFGIGAVAVMILLLVLVGFRVVPPSWDIPLFLLAVALFAVRLTIRTLLARRKPPSSQDPPGV